MNKVHLIEYNYLLVYELFEFAVEWITTIRNNAEIIFSSKNYLHYCITCIICITTCWVVLCSPPQSVVSINSFFSFVLFSPDIHRKEKKSYHIGRKKVGKKWRVFFPVTNFFYRRLFSSTINFYWQIFFSRNESV